MTAEIAISPPNAGLEDFDWRVSMASVTAPGRFSHFTNVDRILVVIEGRLKLVFEDGGKIVELRPDGLPHRFPGDVGVIGAPVDGEVVDLNLMTRRGRWTGAIERIASPGSRSIALSSRHTILIFAGEGCLRSQTEAIRVRPLDAVQVHEAENEAVSVESHSDIYVVRLFPITQRPTQGRSDRIDRSRTQQQRPPPLPPYRASCRWRKKARSLIIALSLPRRPFPAIY